MNISSLNISFEILSLISEIDEYKGSWEVMDKLIPERLTSLHRIATIESIGSSTRIEGSKMNDKEVEALLQNLSINRSDSRDKQEVAGYAEVINTIFQNYQEIPLTENYIKQFHRDLLRYSEKDKHHRGEYKKNTNHVEAFDADGASLGVVFDTASPFETPFRMQHLVEWTKGNLETKAVHPLLIAAIFIVEFLAIHPFQDGNGRLSRILTSYLLLVCGYQYISYSSLEAVIEKNKESYYLALRQTQKTLQTAQPDWQPWIVFFLKALRQQKENLDAKIKREKILSNQLSPLSLKILEFTKARGSITISEVVAITSANRNTVKKNLEMLVRSKHLTKNGTLKGTWYSVK